MGVDRQGLDRLLVSLGSEGAHRAHVVLSRQALQSGAAVEEGVELVYVHARSARKVEDDRGVDVAGARSHDKAFKRREPHRRLHRRAVDHCRHRGAVADVQHDLPKVVAPEDLGDPARDLLMRRPVGAVAANFMFLRDFAVDGVRRRLARKRLEEGGVEDDDVRDVRQQTAGHPDADEVGGVVKRAERTQLLNPRFDGVVDQGRAVEVLSPLDYAVADGLDRSVCQRRADLLKQAEHGFHSHRVIGNGAIDLPAFFAVFVLDAAGLLADALDEPRGDLLARAGVDQLVLDRRAAGVDDEN